jgi:hypothetical protein
MARKSEEEKKGEGYKHTWGARCWLLVCSKRGPESLPAFRLFAY